MMFYILSNTRTGNVPGERGAPVVRWRVLIYSIQAWSKSVSAPVRTVIPLSGDC